MPFLALVLSLAAHAAKPPPIQCSDLYAGFLQSASIYKEVRRIGDEHLLADFRLHPGAHRPEEYFRTVAKVVDVNSFIQAQGIDKYPVYKKLAPLLEAHGPQFKQRFLDPGIVAHGEELAAPGPTRGSCGKPSARSSARRPYIAASR